MNYKLEIIDEDNGMEYTVCTVGYFYSEAELAKWAEENVGELNRMKEE